MLKWAHEGPNQILDRKLPRAKLIESGRVCATERITVCTHAFSESIFHIWENRVHGRIRKFYLKKKKRRKSAIAVMSESGKHSPAQWLITFFSFFSFFPFFPKIFTEKILILFLRTKLNPAKYIKFLSFWMADYITTNIRPIFLF